MAEFSKQIENITNIAEYPNSFKRQQCFPLELYSVFYSKDEAETYAKTNGLAYVGQHIDVVTKTDNGGSYVNSYVISDTKGTLSGLGYLNIELPSAADPDSYTITQGDNAEIKIITPYSYMRKGEGAYSIVANAYEDAGLITKNIAKGSYSIAAGAKSTANKSYSVSLGYNSEANSEASIAAGLGVKTSESCQGQAVFGKYNTVSNDLLIVGAGTESKRENAFAAGRRATETGTEGYIKIGDTQLTETLLKKIISFINAVAFPNET